MNKRQLVAHAARRTSLSKRQIYQALEAILQAIEEALGSGDRVVVADFGRFEAQIYPGRKVRRFDGPGQYEVAARVLPVFKSSAALRRRLREGAAGDE